MWSVPVVFAAQVLYGEAHFFPMSALLLITAVLVFIFIAFHHVILVAIAHLFHPHILGAVVIAVLAVMLLLGLVAMFHAPGAQVVAVQAPQVPMMPQMPQVPQVQMPPMPAEPIFQPPFQVPPAPQVVPNPPGYYSHAEASTSASVQFGPSWSIMLSKFGIFLALVLGIVFFVFLLSGRLKLNLIVNSGVGTMLLLVGMFAAFLVYTKTVRETRQYENNMAELERTHSLTPPVVNAPPVANTPQKSRSTPSGRKSRNSMPPDQPLPESDEIVDPAERDRADSPTEDSPPTEAASNDKPSTGSTADAVSVEKPSSDKPNSKPPAWINEGPQRRGDAYLEVVRAKQFDPNLREEKLNDKLVETVNRYLDDVLLRQPGIGAQLKFDGPYLRSKYVAAEYPTASTPTSEAGDEMFAQLRLDENFRKEAMNGYGKLISGGRLEHAGAISLVVLVLLGGLYSYLRLTPPKVQTAGGAMQNAAFDNRSADSGSIDTAAVGSQALSAAKPQRRMHWAVLMVLTVLLGSLLIWFLLAIFWSVGLRATIG